MGERVLVVVYDTCIITGTYGIPMYELDQSVLWLIVSMVLTIILVFGERWLQKTLQNLNLRGLADTSHQVVVVPIY